MIVLNIQKEDLITIIEDTVRKVLHENNLQQTENNSSGDRILTIKEAAEFLKVSKSSIYKKVEAGIIPHCRPEKTKRLLFSEKDLIEFVKKGKQKSLTEIQESIQNELVNRKNV